MAIYYKGLYNAANFPYVHTVVAQDVADGYVTIDFQLEDRDIAWNVMILDSNNIYYDMAGAVITSPDDGQIRIANGGAFSLIAGFKIHILGMSYDSTALYAS